MNQDVIKNEVKDYLQDDYDRYKELENTRDKGNVTSDYDAYKELERRRDTRNVLDETLVISVDPKRYSQQDRMKLINVVNLKEVNNEVMFVTKKGFKKHIDSKKLVTLAVTGLILITTIGLDRISDVSDKFEETYNKPYTDPYAYNTELELAKIAAREEEKKFDPTLNYNPETYMLEQQQKEQQKFNEKYSVPSQTIITEVFEEEEEEEENIGKGLGK